MKSFADILKYTSISVGKNLIKEKLLVDFIVISFFFAMGYSLFGNFINNYPTVYFLFYGGLVFLINLFLFIRRLTLYRVAAHFYITITGIFIILPGTFYVGGLFSPGLAWLIVIPVISLLLFGVGNATWFWLSISVAVVIFYGTLAVNGFVFPVSYDSQWTNLFDVVIVTGLILIIFLLTIIFEHAKENANKKLEEKNKQIALRNKEITDSIQYAQRIQNTILASPESIKKHFAESFIVYRPKDIVSGDFYWTTEKGNNMYIAICDCTGHGVPGAFMSLLTSNLLGEAINERGLEKPNEIFDYVRSKLIENISGGRDGMDGTIICYNTETGTFTYAAANNTPVLVRNEEIVKLPKDRMPVGEGIKKEPFQEFTIDTKNGDMLYLYTDGFTDLFGGPDGKKFSTKRLLNLFLNIAGIQTHTQKERIETTFDDWRGDWEQIDDMSLIGIRL